MACKVTVLDCGNTEDEKKIYTFSNIAAEQYKVHKNFVDIFPWTSQCKSKYIHFIAHASPNDKTVICGWLSMLILENPSRGYITEISTRRVRDELWGGVGQRLNAAVFEWAAENGLEFLELFPLNEAVRAIYLKPEWGYVAFSEDPIHLYRSVSNTPTQKYLKSRAKKKEAADEIRDLILMLQDAVEDNSDLRRLLRKAKPYIKKDNPLVENFNLIVQGIIGANDEEEEEKEKALSEILTQFIDDNTSRGGGREQRKTRQRRQHCRRAITRRR